MSGERHPMARYAAGDPDAFRELCDRWSDRVYGFWLRWGTRPTPPST